MRYLPQTEKEIQKMSEVIGVKTPSDLFHSIPDSLRLKKLLDLPTALSEQELIAHLKTLSRKNETVDHYTSFLGAGAYHHYIPVAVNYLTGRGEFSTSYTPYQAEISQGTLQAIFEFQTMIASLMGLEVANASNYDGSTSLAEAVLMSLRLQKKKKKILLAQSIHPEYRQVVRTTLQNLGCEIQEIGWTSSGKVDSEKLSKILSEDCAAVCVQSPNFFGVVEDLSSLGQLAHEHQSLFVSVTGDPISLGVLASPGSCGADIAVGEGQAFGNFLNLGGPYLGLFAAKKEFVRQMPGRLVGETVDSQGQQGFVLTLNTREQHIRREKATSNICTNQSLCALGAAIYLSLLGPVGLKKLAEMNLAKAHYAKELLLKLPGVKTPFQGEIFHEFVLQLPKPVEEVLAKLREKKIFGGVSLKSFYPELGESLLVCVTEMVSRGEIERFATELKEVLS
jgi:glycine dehydrogenase subunit 1